MTDAVLAAVRRTDLTPAERRALALGIVVARYVEADPSSVLAAAHRNLDTIRAASTAASARYLETWAELLSGPLAELIEVLTADTERATALRQMMPFAGVIPERERAAVLQQLRNAA